MRPLRIGFITPSLHCGGAERWMLELAKGAGDRLQFGGLAVVWKGHVDPAILDEFRGMMPVFQGGQQGVREVGFRSDILIGWGAESLQWLAGGFHGPVVFVSHGHGKFDQLCARLSVPGATHYVAVGEPAVTPVLAAGIRPERVEVVHNGISQARCGASRSRRAIREELGVAPEEFLVGFVGRLVPEKNPLGAAEAVANLPPRFRIVFIGDGRQRHRFMEEIRERLGSRAIFTGSVTAIGDYYRALDCFVQPSPREGFSLAVLEAMYCGVPCVATRTGILLELERRFGLYWEASPPGTASTSTELGLGIWRTSRLSTEARRQRVRKCREIVRREFLSMHMGDRWVRYLRRTWIDWFSQKQYSPKEVPMIHVIRYRPTYFEGYDPQETRVSTAKELLAIPWVDEFAKQERSCFMLDRPEGTPEQLESYGQPQVMLMARLANGDRYGVAILRFDTWEQACEFHL